ncbi:MAG: hypothetical protein WHT63_08500 [Tepidiforma sp.]
MKLFFDENFGSVVPGALDHVRAPAESFERPRRGGPVAPGATDVEWLIWVGQNGYIGLTEDLAILRSDIELDIARRAGAGVVFFPTGQAPRWRVLRMLLQRWEWLEEVDTTPPAVCVSPRPARARLEALLSR